MKIFYKRWIDKSELASALKIMTKSHETDGFAKIMVN
jgi:hypothetical protein